MYAAPAAIAPWPKLKIPDVLYVSTSPIAAKPYNEPVVRPAMTNGQKSLMTHPPAGTHHRDGAPPAHDRPPTPPRRPACRPRTNSPPGGTASSTGPPRGR